MVAGVSINLSLTGFSAEPNRVAVMVFCAVFFGILLTRLAVAIRQRTRGWVPLVALMSGVTLWAAESALLQTGQSGPHAQDHLASGEVAFLATYVILVVYLMLDADQRPTRAMATWLETAVICGGSASLAGTLLLLRLGGGVEGVPLLVALFYPVADIVLALLVIGQVGLRMRASNRTSWQMCFGFMLLAVADASFVDNVIHGSSGASTVTIVIWGLGFGQLVSAACRRSVQQAIAPARELPATVLIVATVAAVAVLVLRPGGILGMTLLGVAIATLLAAGARMLVALRDARLAAEAFALAQTDELTLLPNRRGVLRRIDEQLKADEPLALMIMDLNGFKEINDTLGHAAGDVILHMSAQRMRAVVPSASLIGRLGGDEFALVVAETDEINLLEIANTALEALRQPAVTHGIELVVDASVGIAVREQVDNNCSDLLRRADVAMYQAKTSGSGVLLYDQGRDEFSRERLRLVEELRHGTEEGQLVLWYQPQIDAATQEICGLEALVRWQHPRRGLVPPAAFLPVARHAGLMPAVSEAVIRRAAADMRGWQEADLAIRVALNCPPPELLSGVFVRQLLGVIAQYGLDSEDFIVEVTEDSFIGDPHRAREIVLDIREEGLGISIDDYGVGFSSLAYLRDLPIDELKVDRSFVASSTSDPRTEMIVDSTIKMAHALDLRVVAEGVEDPATAAMLVAAGVDVLQGFHIARPMPADQVIRWIAEWRAGLAMTQLGENW
jgi:diguanylate cyclase (GGDEF)-like protein